MIRIVRYSLIAIAILAFPGYVLWIGGGYLADRHAQRRTP